MHTVKNVLAMVAGSGGSDSLFLPSLGLTACTHCTERPLPVFVCAGGKVEFSWVPTVSTAPSQTPVPLPSAHADARAAAQDSFGSALLSARGCAWRVA